MANYPPCVGTFAPGDAMCDGDPLGRTEEDRAYCAWRDRCGGLQVYCSERGFAPNKVAATLSQDRLVQLCESYVAKNKIVAGRVNGEEQLAALNTARAVLVAKHKPQASGAEAIVQFSETVLPKQKKQRPRKRALNEQQLEFHTHFASCLQQHFPERRFASGPKILLREGSFYCVDRRKGSHYVSWYCSSSKGRDIAIASMQFHPNLKCVDVMLAVPADKLRSFLGMRALKKLNVTDHKDGQFLAKCKHLDIEGVGISVEALRKLVDIGLIKLPRV